MIFLLFFWGGDMTIKHFIEFITDFLNFVRNNLVTIKPCGQAIVNVAIYQGII